MTVAMIKFIAELSVFCLWIMKHIRYIRLVITQQNGLDVPDGVPSQPLYLTHLSWPPLIKSHQLFRSLWYLYGQCCSLPVGKQIMDLD